jgi:MFS transporter, DHA1 family, multidrug resistance protein
MQEAARMSVRGLLVAAAVAYVAAFAIFFARGSVQQTLTPLMGRDTIGFGAGTLAVLLMASAGFTSLAGPFAGSLSDRFGRTALLLPGLALLAGGTVVLTLATTPVVFIMGFAVISLAGTVNSIPSSLVVDAVSSSQRSFAIGIYRVVGDSALTVAPVLSGLFVDWYGFTAAGLMSAGVVGGAALLAVASLRRRGSVAVQPPAVVELPSAR